MQRCLVWLPGDLVLHVVIIAILLFVLFGDSCHVMLLLFYSFIFAYTYVYIYMYITFSFLFLFSFSFLVSDRFVWVGYGAASAGL